MPITAYHKRLYLCLALLYMLPYIQSVSMGVVSADLMRSLKLTPDQLGILGSSFLYAYAAVQIVSGMIAARCGPRLTLTLLFLIAAAGCVVFATSESLAGAALGRILCGCGMAATLTSALTVFCRWFPPSSYGRITAWLFSIGGLGSFLATVPLAAVNAGIGWRGVFLGLGIITALGAIWVFAVVRDWPPESEARAPAGGGRRILTFAVLWGGLKTAARLPDFWKLCAWYVFMSGTFYAFSGLWAGPYLADVHGMSMTEAGGILSMGAVGFVLGNPLLTWLCENRLRSYRLGLGWACVAGFMGVCLLVGLNERLNMPLLYLTTLLLGMAANAPNAIGYAAAKTLFGMRLAGTIGGILGFSSFIGGAFLQVLCGGLLVTAQGFGCSQPGAYAVAFAPFFLCTLIAGYSGFTLTESYGREDGE